MEKRGLEIRRVSTRRPKKSKRNRKVGNSQRNSFVPEPWGRRIHSKSGSIFRVQQTMEERRIRGITNTDRHFPTHERQPPQQKSSSEKSTPLHHRWMKDDWGSWGSFQDPREQRFSVREFFKELGERSDHRPWDQESNAEIGINWDSRGWSWGRSPSAPSHETRIKCLGSVKKRGRQYMFRKIT